MKDILFVLDAFSHYHETHSQVKLCVIGPVLDRDYADTVSYTHLTLPTIA